MAKTVILLFVMMPLIRSGAFIFYGKNGTFLYILRIEFFI